MACMVLMLEKLMFGLRGEAAGGASSPSEVSVSVRDCDGWTARAERSVLDVAEIITKFIHVEESTHVEGDTG